MDADKSTMVKLIDALEKQRLAERRPDPTDRRAYAVHLTEGGRARLAEAGRIVRRVEDGFLAPLSAAERTRLNQMLKRIADHVSPHKPAPRAEREERPPLRAGRHVSRGPPPLR